jgi:hypothetical protein
VDIAPNQASRDMFGTIDLGPLLAERDVHLSRKQVFAGSLLQRSI